MISNQLQLLLLALYLPVMLKRLAGTRAYAGCLDNESAYAATGRIQPTGAAGPSGACDLVNCIVSLGFRHRLLMNRRTRVLARNGEWPARKTIEAQLGATSASRISHLAFESVNAD